MQTSLAKKLFAGLSTVAMVAAFVPFMASAAVHTAGTNVVSNGTVYYVDASGMKRPYTSAGAFLSYGFNSWSSVVAASAEDLALPTGNFIPPMDGSLINDKGTVYIMVNGQRAGFTSASNFLGLGYSFSNVVPGDTSFMTTMSPIGSTTMAHPAGTLVNDHGTVYLMTATGKQGIPSLAVFNGWGYSFKKVVPANSYDSAVAMSNGVMPAFAMGCLSPLSCAGSVVIPPTGGSLGVALASDSPAAGTLIQTQAAADLAHFTFTGSGTVTGLTLKRIGVSADASLKNVYLFDGATRLTDAATVSSGSTVNFTSASGLFTVNGSKTISVKSDLNAAAGETLGVQLTSYTISGAAAANVAVSGNLFSVASVTPATVSIGTVTAAGATDPGTDINVWQSSLTVGTRDVLMTRLALRQIGSLATSDIKNFKLFVDGTQVSSVAGLDSNGYVTFSGFSTALKTGSRVLKVTADIIGGSSRTYQMSLRGTYDITLTDTQYNVGLAATMGSGNFPAQPASAYSINSGSLSVVKATDSPSLT